MPDQKPLVDATTNLVSNDEASPRQVLRRGFYYDVLTAFPVEPRKDLEKICKAWLNGTGADWVWLWLQHEDREKRPWELTAAIGRHGNPEDYIPEHPDDVAVESQQSVAEYVAKLKRPVLVTDIKNWCRELDGQIHRVVCLSELQKLNCHSFLSVPLVFPKTSVSADISPYSHIGNIRGFICSHFITDSPAEPLQSEDAYMLMGYATTRTIAASFASEQHRIRCELDGLATKYLTTTDEKIIAAPGKYLAEVIRLIQVHLRASFASVFYHTAHDADVIECIASTGLRDETHTLSQDNLSEARYRKGEGLTGMVYETGIPYISKIGQLPKRPGGGKEYKWKERPDNIEESEHSWVCYPIKTPEVIPGDSRTCKILGVLRCFGNESLLARSTARNFDPIQIQALDFISRQLALVLETMSVKIEREREITIIKHDLYNPLRMLDAGVEAVTDQIEERCLPKNWEDRMKFSLAMARNLAGGLSEKESFHKALIHLAGDVLTPLMSGLRYFAHVENNMTIRFDDNITQFPRLNADRDLVERALFNLVVNAIKYGNRETEIKITGEQSNVACCLHISNEGIGVDEADRDRIFIGEYRSPKVRHLKQGLGFGLKIARAAMEKNGGQLLLTSLRNPTTFTIVFQK